MNETMARAIWPHAEAIGKCIRIGHAPGEAPVGLTIAGAACQDDRVLAIGLAIEELRLGTS